MQAKDSLPAVFTIISILERRQELDQIIAGPESRLSLPKVLGADEVVRPVRELNDNINGGEILRNALEGDRRGEERMKEQERKMMEINRRMRS